MGVGGSEMGRSHAFPPVCGRAEVHRRRRNAPGQRKHPARRRISRLPSRLSENISLRGVAKGPGPRDAIPTVSKQRFARAKDGKPHPQNAPGQQRHPARRQLSRPSSRLSGNFSLCGRKGSCTTICDRVCASRNTDARPPEAEHHHDRRGTAHVGI